MEFKVTQQNFSRALSLVARIASAKNTLPILSNVLFRVKNNRLQITATNLDIAINIFIGAKIIKDGSVTIPARLLQDFISNLPESTIQVSQKENKIQITADKYTSTINGVAPDEFPVMPTIGDGETWEIDAEDLKEGLQQVVGAASNDDTRPVLTGVYIHTKDNKLFFATTDSYRLAEKQIPFKQTIKPLLVPVSAIQELLKIVGSATGSVGVTQDGQQVIFKTEDTELIARLIDGKYPDYQKLIPNNFKSTADVSRQDIISITKVSSLFARESAGSIVIKLDKKEKQIYINSVASQIGENSSCADAKISEDGEITLNSRYLLEALQSVKGDSVVIGFNGSLEPVVVKNPKQADYIHIIMPLKS